MAELFIYFSCLFLLQTSPLCYFLFHISSREEQREPQISGLDDLASVVGSFFRKRCKDSTLLRKSASHKNKIFKIEKISSETFGGGDTKVYLCTAIRKKCYYCWWDIQVGCQPLIRFVFLYWGSPSQPFFYKVLLYFFYCSLLFYDLFSVFF